MKNLLICFSFLVPLIVKAQGETLKYYSSSNAIIESNTYEKKYYTIPVVSSNSFSLRTYELTGTVSLANELPIDSSRQRKKSIPREISPEEARAVLLTEYDEIQILINTYKLREEFPYAVEYRNHGIYRYRSGQTIFTSEPVEVQRERIRLRCEREYDSLVTLHKKYTTVVNEFEKTNQDFSLEQMSVSLSSLPNFDNGGSLYITAILNKVIEKDPSLYFAYMEMTTGSRKPYYGQIDRQHFKLLKKVRTNSPIKKEIVKFRNSNTFTTAGIITLTTVVDAAFIGGIIYLFTRI